MRILTLIFFLISIGVSQLSAQIPFRVLDEDPGIQIKQTHISDQGKLIALDAQKLIGFQNGIIVVKEWNGLFWIEYPDLYSQTFQTGKQNKISIESHQGDIYIGGSFKNANETINGLARWNGSEWEMPNLGISGDYRIHKEISVDDMSSYQEELFICGLFNKVGLETTNNLASLKNNQWTTYASNSSTFNSFVIVNDTLYLGGLFQSVEGITSNNIIAYNNEQWTRIAYPHSSEVKLLGKYSNSLLAISDSVYLQSSNGWQNLKQGWEYSIIKANKIVEHNNLLILSGTFKGPSGISHLLQWDGVRWVSLVQDADLQPQGELDYFINSSKGILYLSGNISSFQGHDVDGIIELQPGKSLVKGRVYLDQNENCMFDLGDQPIANTILSVNNGFYYTSTDDQGFYSVFISNNNTNTIQAFPGTSTFIHCDHPLQIIETFDRDSIINRDFAIAFKPEPKPLEGTILSSSGYRAKHGYASSYLISLDQVEHEYFPVSLKLQFNSELELSNFSQHPILIEDGLATWIVSDKKPIYFDCTPPPQFFNTGDQIHFVLNGKAVNYASLLHFENNLEQVIVSAYDPNDKQVDKHEIPINTEDLKYYIRFQNLGTDSARNIHIVDTIDHNIPLEYLKVLGTSHQQFQNSTFKVRDHAIVWSFKELYLPPKQLAGEELSSGYINFKNKLKPDLLIGDSFKNTAYIYFDFQPAVITNDVLSVVIEDKDQKESHSSFLVYPNPTEANLNIWSKNSLISKIEIVSTDGKLLGLYNLAPASQSIEIETLNLRPGTYYVRIYHSQGIVVKPIVIAY